MHSDLISGRNFQPVHLRATLMRNWNRLDAGKECVIWGTLDELVPNIVNTISRPSSLICAVCARIVASVGFTFNHRYHFISSAMFCIQTLRIIINRPCTVTRIRPGYCALAITFPSLAHGANIVNIVHRHNDILNWTSNNCNANCCRVLYIIIIRCDGSVQWMPPSSGQKGVRATLKTLLNALRAMRVRAKNIFAATNNLRFK